MSSIFALPFPEAEAFFKDKLNIPTEKWNDLKDEEHAKAFMTAGAMKADLLADLRAAVDKAIDGKMPLSDFKKQFDSIVNQHGWQYNGNRNWRSELIWSQNITTAYQAGRWQQFDDSDTEYLLYRHQDGQMYPRLTHKAWNNTVLPKGHEWWNTHFAPNGYRCKCRIYRASKADYDNAPNKGDRPDGVPADTGFNYNPGKAGKEKSHELLDKVIKRLPPDIAEQLRKEITDKRALLWDKNGGLPDCSTVTAFNLDAGGGCIKAIPGQKTWRNYTRDDLRHIDPQFRMIAPRLLQAGTNDDEALYILEQALGLNDEILHRIIKSPVENVIIRKELLYHIVEKRSDARERYALFMEPTITNPYEIWKTEYSDGYPRHRYIAAFTGDNDLSIVARINRDGSTLWNIMQRDDRRMNKMREGELLYAQ